MLETGTGEKQQSPIKLALAVGLTVVFLVVVAVQVKTYSGNVTSGTRQPRAAAHVKQDDDAPVEQDGYSSDDKRVVQWPSVDLGDCIAYDPFASPEDLNSKEHEQANLHDTEEAHRRELELARKRAVQAQALSDLKEAGVRAVIQGPGQNVAILGADTIRVGEEIHGHRVVAIDSHGIVLEPITDQ